MMRAVGSKKLVLLLGGARSGKSAFAEQRASALSSRVLFVATATAGDDEMHRRILAHRQSRPATWRTLEEPLAVPSAIARELTGTDVVLVDCLTVWVSNLLLQLGGEEAGANAQDKVVEQVSALVDVFRAGPAHFIVIANEVGLGLVPPYPLGRLYRDSLGRANQLLAAAADEVYLLVAGLPLVLKKGE